LIGSADVVIGGADKENAGSAGAGHFKAPQGSITGTPVIGGIGLDVVVARSQAGQLVAEGFIFRNPVAHLYFVRGIAGGPVVKSIGFDVRVTFIGDHPIKGGIAISSGDCFGGDGGLFIAFLGEKAAYATIRDPFRK